MIPSFISRGLVRLQNMGSDQEKVLRLIRSLDMDKAHGCDDISSSMTKICDESIVEPLCLISENCLKSGVYPPQWKKANIIPIHKKGNRQSKENYRPLLLLPLFGKFFEKLMFGAIYSHLCENTLLFQHQSGFRQGDSTNNHLLSITNDIYKAFEEVPSKEMHAIFLDLLKAFDRVWHNGLIYKPKVNGMSGNILQLLQNFLKDQQQHVVLNGTTSKWKSISAGLPQGSVLGLLFFLIYINDIISNITCGIKLYADDTSLFSVVDDENITACVLNRNLEKINLWAWQWKMQFNANKMEEVIFSCKRLKIKHPKLRLGNDEIASKNEHKHLGLILDSKLDVKSHIRETILKARKGIGIIKCLSNYVCRDVLEQIYKLHIRPHLDYGDIIYHKHDPELHLHFTQQVEQTQYSAALAVTGAWRGTGRQRL